MAEVIKDRYGLVVSFDVENGSPNSDPDTDNLPRINPESGYGIVTGMYLKRKIRSYVGTLEEDEPGYKIYIQEDVSLDRSDNTAYIEFRTDGKGIKESKKKGPQVDQRIRGFTCRSFLDTRVFGTVMTTFVEAALSCGQVRGPVQLGLARNTNPTVNQEVTIIHVTITIERDAENKSTGTGGKNVIPYTLYRTESYISANLARKSTGFSEGDSKLLWDAIINVFEVDHLAARGGVTVRRLVMFKHSRELGDCPAYKLFDAVEAKENEGVECPKKYGDYTVVVYKDQIPVTVEVPEKI